MGRGIASVTSVFVVAIATIGAACADDSKLPLVTAENASQHANQNVLVEMAVIEVKFAQRRQFHFLSGTANFRAENNIPVAIRATDIGQFHNAGIKDLSANYLGRSLRAQGKLIRDESQWLVVVSSPRQIELLVEAKNPAAMPEFAIINEQGQRTVLSLAPAEGVSRSKVTLEHEGNQELYEGITVAELLKQAKIPSGEEARGTQLGRYLIVKGGDGHAAVFSLAEVDPFYADNPPLLVDQLNSQPSPANRGPLRLIVPADKHRRRWVGQVTEIEVRNALDNAAPAATK